MKIVEGFVLRNVMGQAAVIGEGVGQVSFDKLITLNDSAAYLWQSVEGIEFEISDLVKLLVDRYHIDYQCALQDAETLVNQWINLGIVE